MGYKLFGYDLQSPVIAGSSPLSLDGNAMIDLYRAGAGAVVTKNVCLPAQRNPYHYMRISNGDTLINCERALDYDQDRWIEEEIPKAAKAGVVVIANIGTQRHMVENLAERLERAGVAMFECVSYVEDWLVDVVDETRRQTKLPILAKISPNYKDVVRAAGRCVEAGADGFTVGDSIGPIMRIDIETGKPFSGGVDGLGWMSGSALFPFALRNVVEIRKHFDLPIIGMGGVTHPEDAIEMFMGGADFVGLCSALVTHGTGVIPELNDGIEAYLRTHGYDSLEAIKALVHQYLPDADDSSVFKIAIDQARCNGCGACIKTCVYDAIRREAATGDLIFDIDRCSGCGMCLNRCDAIHETE